MHLLCKSIGTDFSNIFIILSFSLLRINSFGKFEFNKSKPLIAAPFSHIYGKLEPSSLLNSKISFSVLLVLGIIKIPLDINCFI